jgi:hypothetical protein
VECRAGSAELPDLHPPCLEELDEVLFDLAHMCRLHLTPAGAGSSGSSGAGLQRAASMSARVANNCFSLWLLQRLCAIKLQCHESATELLTQSLSMLTHTLQPFACVPASVFFTHVPPVAQVFVPLLVDESAQVATF